MILRIQTRTLKGCAFLIGGYEFKGAEFMWPNFKEAVLKIRKCCVLDICFVATPRNKDGIHIEKTGIRNAKDGRGKGEEPALMM